MFVSSYIPFMKIPVFFSTGRVKWFENPQIFSIHVYYQHVIHCRGICDPVRYQRCNQQSYFKEWQTYITVNKLYLDIFIFLLNSVHCFFNEESSNTIPSILKWRQIPNNVTWPDDVIVEIRMIWDELRIYIVIC
jgi:hypothetical protein